MKTFSIQALHKLASRRPPGYVNDVLSRGSVENDKVTLTDETYQELVAKYNASEKSGPGTELKKLLSKIGIKSSPTCSCNQRAKAMDERGIEWCEQNVETICDWLAEESAKRKLPFLRAAGKLIINMAIKRAKKHNSQ